LDVINNFIERIFKMHDFANVDKKYIPKDYAFSLHYRIEADGIGCGEKDIISMNDL